MRRLRRLRRLRGLRRLRRLRPLLLLWRPLLHHLLAAVFLLMKYLHWHGAQNRRRAGGVVSTKRIDRMCRHLRGNIVAFFDFDARRPIALLVEGAFDAEFKFPQTVEDVNDGATKDHTNEHEEKIHEVPRAR